MIDEIVDRYVKLRDRKDEISKAAKDQIAVIDAAMKRCEAYILDHFQKTGQTSAGTASGTAYIAPVTSATVADWDALLNWIRTNNGWQFLDHKVNKTAVIEFKAANDDLPPGVNWREESVVRIRRS